MVPITVNTGLVPLMGKPLSFSFAPRMQNTTYKALGLDLVYFPLEVENDHLEKMVQAFRYMNSPGFAVTKPNKIKVIEYLDGLDELAEKMGAVNTVVKRDGKLIGYNTDGEGFIHSMKENTGIDFKENAFFCFGAGGAGRAACSCLAFYGAKKIVITDAVDEAAKSLAEDINKIFAPVASWIPFEEKVKHEEEIRTANVVMNCTGLGMFPDINETPIDISLMNKDQIAFDATYNPTKTLFLKEAELIGCKILNGEGMSYCQGAIQINLWTGKPAPFEQMKAENDKIVAEMQAAQK